MLAANLPYIPSSDIERLPVAASFEPRQALDGGSDGLEIIRALLDRVPRVLRSDGVALVEIGSDQGERLAVEVDARMPGWSCEVLPDLSGLPRVARLEPRPTDPVV